MGRRLVTYIALLLLGISCRCSQTSNTPDYEGALQQVSRVITTAQRSETVGTTRLTPEQMSATLAGALGINNLWGDDSQYDPIVDFFGVALGQDQDIGCFVSGQCQVITR